MIHYLRTTRRHLLRQHHLIKSMLRNFTSNSHHEELLSRIRTPPSDNLYSSILPTSEHLLLCSLHSLSTDWLSALRLFLSSDQHHTTATYNKIIDLLGRARQFYLVRSLLRDMTLLRLTTPETFATVARRLIAAGRYQEAISTFNSLPDIGLRKNHHTFIPLLDCLCKNKKVFLARELLRFHASEFPPDSRTLTILLHGWCVIGRTDLADRTLAEMKALGFPPTVVAYSAILHAHCRKLDLTKAYETLDRMSGEGIPPTAVAYTSIVHALERSGNVEAIPKIVDRMRSDGCDPDVFFYNTIISILGRAGRIEDACRVFEIDMHRHGLSPDLSTYNTLISVLSRNGRRKMALKLFKKMIKNSSLKPDAHTFNPLLKLFLSTERDLDGLFSGLLTDMVNRYRIGLDSTTYVLLLRGLCRVGRCEEAFFVLEMLASRDVLPMDPYVYDVLVAEAQRKGFYDTVDWLRNLKRKYEAFYCKRRG